MAKDFSPETYPLRDRSDGQESELRFEEVIPSGATVLTIEEARAVATIRAQCLQLLRAYYLNPEVPLQYALDHEATHVYLATADAQLAAIFFARLPERVLQDRPLIGYMGLTAAANRDSEHLARRLWKEYLEHARGENDRREIWVWYRTASPFGLYPCHALLSDGEPRLDGGFSKNGAALISELRSHYRLPSDMTESHPFVVRQYASTRYSESERIRIKRFGRPEAVRLFRDLSINEADGDRLLLIGRVP